MDNRTKVSIQPVSQKPTAQPLQLFCIAGPSTAALDILPPPTTISPNSSPETTPLSGLHGSQFIECLDPTTILGRKPSVARKHPKHSHRAVSPTLNPSLIIYIYKTKTHIIFSSSLVSKTHTIRFQLKHQHPSLFSPHQTQSLPIPSSNTHLSSSLMSSDSSSSGFEKFVRRLSGRQNPTTTRSSPLVPTRSSALNLNKSTSDNHHHHNHHNTKLSFRNLLDMKRPSSLSHSQGSGSASLSRSPSPLMSGIPFLASRRQACKPQIPTLPTIPSALQPPSSTPPPSTTLLPLLDSSLSPEDRQVLSAPPTTLTFSISKKSHILPMRKRITSLIQRTPYPSISSQRPPLSPSSPMINNHNKAGAAVPSPPSSSPPPPPASLVNLYRPPSPPFKVLNRGAFKLGGRSMKIKKRTSLQLLTTTTSTTTTTTTTSIPTPPKNGESFVQVDAEITTRSSSRSTSSGNSSSSSSIGSSSSCSSTGGGGGRAGGLHSSGICL